RPIVSAQAGWQLRRAEQLCEHPPATRGIAAGPARDIVGDQALAERVIDDIGAIRVEEAQALRGTLRRSQRVALQECPRLCGVGAAVEIAPRRLDRREA